jgi:Putative transposase DNA-binding domain
MSSRCPECGHRHKPKGRVWHCRKCGFRGHRDLVGSVNMHENAYSAKVTFPASVTYLRPGPCRHSAAAGAQALNSPAPASAPDRSRSPALAVPGGNRCRRNGTRVIGRRTRRLHRCCLALGAPPPQTPLHKEQPQEVCLHLDRQGVARRGRMRPDETKKPIPFMGLGVSPAQNAAEPHVRRMKGSNHLHGPPRSICGLSRAWLSRQRIFRRDQDLPPGSGFSRIGLRLLRHRGLRGARGTFREILIARHRQWYGWHRQAAPCEEP